MFNSAVGTRCGPTAEHASCCGPCTCTYMCMDCKRCSVTLGGVMISGWLFGCPVPRHQFIDAVLRPAVHQACQQISEIGLRIDAIELAGLDQRCQAGPVFSPFVTAGKKAVLS